MKQLEKHHTERRRFISAVSGLLAGLFLPAASKAELSKRDCIRQFIRNVETDNWHQARPRRQPGSLLQSGPAGFVISTAANGRPITVCSINRTGAAVWQACTGSNSLRDIAAILSRKHAVPQSRAYVDSLCFLIDLHRRGLVEV
jgi:hypothetical protein